MPDVSRLNGHQTIAEQNASKDSFVNEFANRTEFHTLYDQYQTADSFVNALCQQAGVNPANKQSLINNYTGKGRANTLRAFIETPEVQSQFLDRGFITMLYFGYLRRDGEAVGFDFWMEKLQSSGHDHRSLVGGFINSDEYRFRFALVSAH
jgi:hypothetical protein